jgi:hypothetical protein
MRTEEPIPRDTPAAWAPYGLDIVTTELLTRPGPPSSRSFADVIAKRRSTVGDPIMLSSVAELLWYAVGWKGYAPSGRAGLPIAWSTSPSSGGLQSINVVCVPYDGLAPRLYDPVNHAFLVLKADNELVHLENRKAVLSVTGTHNGCTLRLVGDRSKLYAAYENAQSLMLRDAGAVLATVCLCAEWLGLSACPLGFLGNAMLPLLGLPEDRFQAVGGIQLSSPKTAIVG